MFVLKEMQTMIHNKNNSADSLKMTGTNLESYPQCIA